MLLKLVHKVHRETILPNLFYESSISLTQNQRRTQQIKGNYTSIFLMNINAKMQNKTPTNGTQQHMKKIIHHDQVVLIPGMQDGLTYTNW
jgi:hypothetical protein